MKRIIRRVLLGLMALVGAAAGFLLLGSAANAAEPAGNSHNGAVSAPHQQYSARSGGSTANTGNASTGNSGACAAGYGKGGCGSSTPTPTPTPAPPKNCGCHPKPKPQPKPPVVQPPAPPVVQPPAPQPPAHDCGCHPKPKPQPKPPVNNTTNITNVNINKTINNTHVTNITKVETVINYRVINVQKVVNHTIVWFKQVVPVKVYVPVKVPVYQAPVPAAPAPVYAPAPVVASAPAPVTAAPHAACATGNCVMSCDQYNAVIASLKTQLAALQAENSSLKAQAKNSADLQVKLDSATAQVTSLKADVDQLKVQKAAPTVTPTSVQNDVVSPWTYVLGALLALAIAVIVVLLVVRRSKA